jgi:hypothetical protein
MERKEEPKTSNSELKDLKLTKREWKGFVFEVEVQNLLVKLGFSYDANPINEYAWKHENIHHKVDITLANGLRIECKHIDGKVYLSWFKRDWLPKGNCVFVFKGDLKLSPAIIEQYHPILVHYSLLPIYLRYELPLFRGVTRLFEPISIKNVEARKYLPKTLELNTSEEKVQAKTRGISVVGDITHVETIKVWR